MYDPLIKLTSSYEEDHYVRASTIIRCSSGDRNSRPRVETRTHIYPSVNNIEDIIKELNDVELINLEHNE